MGEKIIKIFKNDFKTNKNSDYFITERKTYSKYLKRYVQTIFQNISYNLCIYNFGPAF